MAQAQPSADVGALYESDGESFYPSPLASSPWAHDAQHGGPVTALLARAIEQRFCSPEMQPARLSVDLFRAVPMKPCRIALRPLREGRRINVVEATLFCESTEVSRASALLLRRSQQPRLEPIARDPDPPPGPEGLESTSLIPSELQDRFPGGFHSSVEIRWATPLRAPRPAAWIRMPMALVEGETISAFQRAAALADLGNALASLAHRRGPTEPPGFINADDCLYLTRLPVGEWLGLQTHLIEEHDGVGLSACVLYDTLGRIGRTLSSRLAVPLD